MAWVGVVTNAGRALLDSYAAGGHTLNLTGATVGSGTVDEANLRIQTSVSSEKDSASIISTEEIEGGVKYKVQVGPASASVGAYTAHQIGLWAKLDNGANTLLMLAQDAEAGVSVPLASVSPAFAFALFLALSVDNTDDLTVNIDESAYVTVGTMRGAIDELKVLPFVVDVTSGQWSGSGSDWYITVTADNVTEDSILVPNYDNASAAYLKGPVWCVPAEGSFTIHTSAIPSGTVKIMVQMLGVMGEAQYQVLADVYSTSQTYSKDQAVAKTDIIDNLTSGNTNPVSSGGVYDALAWKSSASLEATGQTPISMSGITFREMLVVARINNTDNKEVFYLPKEALGGWYRLGGESGSLSEALVTIYATENGVTLTNAGLGGTDYTSATKVKVYYR